jgi:hypothetical protein
MQNSSLLEKAVKTRMRRGFAAGVEKKSTGVSAVHVTDFTFRRSPATAA